MTFSTRNEVGLLSSSSARQALTVPEDRWDGVSAFVVDGDSQPLLRAHPLRNGKRSKAQRRGSKPSRFASISMAASQPDNKDGGRAVPAFMIASATETTQAAPGVPAWRVALGNVAAGAVAGATVEAVLYPIDTIKTRLQAMRGGQGVRALLAGSGGKALYAGVFGNLVGVVPSSAIFMAVYEPTKQAVMARVPEERSFLGPIAAGALAGLASSVVRVPTEVVKQRMQTGEFTRALGAVRSIIAAEGVGGMYAGYRSFLLRDLPFDAIEFVAYEQLKKVWRKAAGGRELHPLETSAIGAVAGAVTGAVTTPLDVIKTRLMIQGKDRVYKGVVDCATKIAKEEGVAALFRGWEPRVIWIGLGGCVFFTALEEAKKVFVPQAPPPLKSCCAGNKN